MLFIAGLFVGAFLGMLVMAVLAIDEEDKENFWKEGD